MDEPGWNLSIFLGELPLYVTLIAGIVVCVCHRRRSGRVARLLAIILAVELIWDSVGWKYCRQAVQRLGFHREFSLDDLDQLDWTFQYILSSLPGAVISALIWGSALTLILGIDDRPLRPNGSSERKPGAATRIPGSITSTL